MIGNEGKGISKVVEAITDVRVGIPMSGSVNSFECKCGSRYFNFCYEIGEGFYELRRIFR